MVFTGAKSISFISVGPFNNIVADFTKGIDVAGKKLFALKW